MLTKTPSVQASVLPDFIIEAQNAVRDNAEVQDMIRKLSAYGLAVTIPHKHTTDAAFAPLEQGLVQLERNGVVTFESETAAIDPAMVPVSWRWLQGEGLSVSGICNTFSYCQVAPNGMHINSSGHTPTQGDG